jgi:hypothetical protein
VDFHGKFSTYRVDTEKFKDATGKLDLVVAVCTPTLDGTSHISRAHVWTKTCSGVRYVIDGLGENTYLDFARNRAVDICRDASIKRFNRLPNYYLWLDQDNVFPDDLFFRLHKHNVDIVSGSYVRKGGAWQWVFEPVPAEKDWEAEGKSGLMECRYVGFGACLVKGEVFDKMKSPWFKQDTQKITIDGKPGIKEVGEDVYFCNKAREAGYKVWVDTNTHVGHMGAVIWPKDAYAFHKGMMTSGQQDYLDSRKGKQVELRVLKQEAI